MFGINGACIRVKFIKEITEFGWAYIDELFLDWIKDHYGEITQDMNVNDLILLYEMENDLIDEATKKNFINGFNKELLFKFNKNGE